MKVVVTDESYTRQKTPSPSASDNESKESNAFISRWITFLLQHIQRFIKKQVLIVFLISGLLLAVTVPSLGANLDDIKWNGYKLVHTSAVIVIFFINGLKMRSQEAKAALREKKALLWGLFTILFVTCVIGVKMNESAEFLGPDEFKLGLSIFLLTPTTAAMGIVLTEQAEGNVALAIGFTVFSRVAVFFTPLYLEWLMSSSADTNFDVAELGFKLVITILLPIFFGKMFVINKCASAWVGQHSYELKVIQCFCIAVMGAFLKVSSGIQSGKFDGIRCEYYFILGAWWLLIHGVFILVNYTVGKMLGLPSSIAAPTLLMGSQKSLPYAVTVIGFLPPDMGDSGLMTIPSIISQQCQLYFDSILVEFLKPRERVREETLMQKASENNCMCLHDENT